MSLNQTWLKHQTWLNQTWLNQAVRALVIMAVLLLLVVGQPLPVLAQQVPRTTATPPQPTQNWWQSFTNLFVARRTRVGLPEGKPEARGRRGQCPAIAALGIEEIPLTALVPKATAQSTVRLGDGESQPDIVWGRTVSAHPTFWIYLPYYRQPDLEFAKFVLLDDQKRVVVGPIFLPLPEAATVAQQPVLAKFTLPQSEKPLEVNQSYKWFFSIVCDARKPSRNPSVSGWIERIAPPYPIALYQGLPTTNDYLYYAQAGIWYDTITRIADSRKLSLQPQLAPQPTPTEVGQLPFLPQTSLQDNWLGLFQFLFQSPNVNEENANSMADQVANAAIVELFPVSAEQLTGKVSQR